MKISRVIIVAIYLCSFWVINLSWADSPDPAVIQKFQPGKTWQGVQKIEGLSGNELGEQRVTFSVTQDGKVTLSLSGTTLRLPSRAPAGAGVVPAKEIRSEGNFGIDGDGQPVVFLIEGKREFALRLEEGRVVTLDSYEGGGGKAKHKKAFLK